MVRSNRSVSSDKGVEDVAQLQKEIAQLRAQSFSDAEARIGTLKSQVHALKGELKSREEKPPVDTSLVKLLLKNNIRYAEDKNNDQLMALRAAMEAINVTELETKTNNELSALKKELTKIKEQLQQKEAEDRTRKEIANLKTDVLTQLKVAEGHTQEELKKMMQSVECMANKAEYEETQQELEKVKAELAQVKDELKETEKASKVRLELMTLKKSLEMELWNSQGMNKQEIKAIKAAIKKMDKAQEANKTVDELSDIQRDVKALKEEIKTKEESAAVQRELDGLKDKVSELLEASEGKSKEEMLVVKAAIDSISARQQDMTDKTELEEMRAELVELRQQMADKEEADRIKEELTAIKESLQSEILEAKQKNREAFDALRETFANLKASEDAVHDTALKALTAEVKKLKDEVEEQNRANHELAKLQKELTGKLEVLDSDDEDNQDLFAVKKVVDAVAAFDADEDSGLVMDDLVSLKGSIKEAEASVKSPKDLEVVKYALEKKLQSTDGMTRVQLEEIISVVENLDLESIGDNPTHAELKKEIGATKHAFKSRELYSALSKLEVLFKSTRSNRTRAENNRIRREITSIKTGAENQSLEQLEGSLASVTAMYADIQANPLAKKEKKGLRKFFSNLVGRRGDKKSSSATLSVASGTDSAQDTKPESNRGNDEQIEKQEDPSFSIEQSDVSGAEDQQESVKDNADVVTGSVRSRQSSAVRSKFSFRSKASGKSSTKQEKVPQTADDKMVGDEVVDYNNDGAKESGPPAVVSLDISDAGSVVSHLSKQQYGELASVGSASSRNVKNVDRNNDVEARDQPETVEECNDQKSVSSKRSKRSMRSAMSKKSSKSSSSKKKSTIGMSQKEIVQESNRMSTMSKPSGMPPLHPNKQMFRATQEPEEEEVEEFVGDYYDNHVIDNDDDDDVLENVSVAMVSRNEQGEFDVETVVEPTNSLVLPLTMSI